MDDRTKQALDRALEWVAREDCHLDEARIRGYMESGAWTAETFVELLERHATERPDVPAIADSDGTTLTWSELRARAEGFAASLLELGFVQGDRLGIQLPNWSEFLVVVMGAARIGVVPTFTHMPYRAYELEYILGLTEARGFVVPGTLKGFDHIALGLQLCDRLPKLEHVISVRADDDRVLSFEALVADGMTRGRLLDAAPKPLSTDLFMVMFTSGTTGRPKGVTHMHATLLAAARNYLRDLQWGPNDRWLVVSPLSHLTAFGLVFVGGGLAAGGAMTLLEAWDAPRALELVDRDQITHYVGAPPMLIDLVRQPDLQTRDLSSLRFMMYAGAPCPLEILRRLHERLGCAFAVFYGWTEGLATTYTVPGDPLEIVASTVGRSAPGMEQEIVDDEGNVVPDGVRGEMWGRGPQLSPGYYHQPEAMAQRYHPHGWFMTGDIMVRNEDRTFAFFARKDDMINRGGYKIDPREIEELLYQHPSVAAAVVIGQADDRLGQRACAYIVPSGEHQLNLDEMKAFLEEKGLAKPKWPERVEIVDRLPMTPTGKIMRYELRARNVETAG